MCAHTQVYVVWTILQERWLRIKALVGIRGSGPAIRKPKFYITALSLPGAVTLGRSLNLSKKTKSPLLINEMVKLNVHLQKEWTKGIHGQISLELFAVLLARHWFSCLYQS